MLTHRGVAGEASTTPTSSTSSTATPVGALASAMNRALKIKGPQVGASSPISKTGARKTQHTVTRSTGGGGVGGGKEADTGVYRFLGEMGGGSCREGGGGKRDGGVGGGSNQFLQDVYGIDGKFHAHLGQDAYAPDAARVLGRVLGFSGDLIRPTSLLAQACFECSGE